MIRRFASCHVSLLSLRKATLLYVHNVFSVTPTFRRMNGQRYVDHCSCVVFQHRHRFSDAISLPRERWRSITNTALPSSIASLYRLLLHCLFFTRGVAFVYVSVIRHREEAAIRLRYILLPEAFFRIVFQKLHHQSSRNCSRMYSVTFLSCKQRIRREISTQSTSSLYPFLQGREVSEAACWVTTVSLHPSLPSLLAFRLKHPQAQMVCREMHKAVVVRAIE